MPPIGHEYLWLRDLLADILRDTPLGNGAGQIPELVGWHRIDTSREPRLPRGLRSVPLRDSTAVLPPTGPPAGPSAPRLPSATIGRHRNRFMPPHSKMSAAAWVKVARCHPAPVTPHDHPKEALSDISALMKGDSSLLFASTGLLFTSGELSAFGNTVESRVRTHELIQLGDLSGLRSSLRSGGSANAAPLLADQTAVPVQEPNLGATGELPIAPSAATAPTVTVAPRAADSSAGAPRVVAPSAAGAPHAAAPSAQAALGTLTRKRKNAAERTAKKKQKQIAALGGGAIGLAAWNAANSAQMKQWRRRRAENAAAAAAAQGPADSGV